MKEKIHPKYGSVLVSCASCGNRFLVGSTRLDGAKKEYQGKEYPAMTLEICSQCHPYFSGKQIYVDTAGRVEKFQRRYGSLTGAKQEAPAAKKAEKPKEAAPAEAPKKEAARARSDTQAKPRPPKPAKAEETPKA